MNTWFANRDPTLHKSIHSSRGGYSNIAKLILCGIAQEFELLDEEIFHTWIPSQEFRIV
jgi:hypothetical protein